MNKIIEHEEIMNIIPHRYPFLFVDKVEIEEVGKKGIGYKNVTANEYYFQGHFPGKPVMPGVIIIETMAQVGAVILLSQEDFKGRTPYFAGINKFRFKKVVKPGDTLETESIIVRNKGPFYFAESKGKVNGKLCVSAEYSFMIQKGK